MKVKSNDDWRLTPEAADYIALVYEAAAANGWSRQSVGGVLGKSASLEAFRDRTQKYFAPEAPSVETWYSSEEGGRYLETVYEAAAANGWTRHSVRATVGNTNSLETFKERSQRYFSPEPPSVETWQSSEEGARYLETVVEVARANGWNYCGVWISAGKAPSLDIFKERSQKYFNQKPLEQPREQDWRDTEEGATYLALVTEAAVANGWSRQGLGASSGQAKSLEAFKECSQKYFTQKPPEQPKESTWRDTKEGSRYLKSVYESALANGWSKHSVVNLASKSTSLDNFIAASQKFFSQKPPEKVRTKTWKDTEEGSLYLACVYEAAKANGWSGRSVGNMAMKNGFAAFKESSQKYFAPPPVETPEEQWGSWIRDQQIASGLPVAYHKSNWSQAWRVSVCRDPDNHPDLEQSARAFVAAKIKDLDYLKAIEWARTDFEGKVRLLMEWLLEGYNNFPIKPEKISNSDGRIDASALRAAVTKVSRKKKWSHLQPLFPASFWTELSHAIQDLEQAEPIAA